MYSDVLKSRNEEIAGFMAQSGLDHYQIILISETEQKGCFRTGCVCAEILQNLETKVFDNPGCWFVSEPRCLSVPLYFSSRPFGFLIAGCPDGFENRKEWLNELQEKLYLTGFDIYRQLLHERAMSRWNKPVYHIGGNETIMVAHEKLVRFALSKSPVLLTGETGVGKELFARSLALMGNYWERPFFTVNCGQFHDENMMVSELFGHCKGSFTGAAADHAGIFEQADGGTIFLDEIGELSMNAQKMLLRVIDQQEIKPLGCKQIRHVDVWVISATHRDLGELAEKGHFREDLYYRISGLCIHIPALRDRGRDSADLARFFLEQLNEEHGIRKTFSPGALEFLEKYDYPGNIRELKNIVENGFWMSTKNIIGTGDLESKVTGKNREEEGLEELYGSYCARFKVGENFWDTLYSDFKKRKVNIGQMRFIIGKDLCETGQYMKLLRKYNLPKSDYLRFMDFLRHQKLKPDRGK